MINSKIHEYIDPLLQNIKKPTQFFMELLVGFLGFSADANC